ncbi:thiol reductant ABC exporter subunit CydC [Alkalihalophilus marmarensis]|jgi:ATP-binding cassette subfamily C protein CydC|uniref:thiol reductant ABC exporter subunit CydC n=1 Tax=Alkalihalophilus marmarensis TaxID=521377 RepID=UPI00203B8B50|nr:thiol reductant ABC exporter subunit CydC [Alkalihalophilus marmarensis]MCM3490102.1 thiol reductant ABC exporter subunit CydC [Alkalihalophilus marmarensis]MED1600351.1 thiol reductant ABC exporter subunit CydC [Alkalihalophilus marmarensis]
MKELANVAALLLSQKRDIVYSVLLGFLAGLAAIGLFSASGYLISKAALVPPLYALSIMIALLKLFSISRAAARYGERLFSHRATFTMLGDLRVSFYEKLEPHAPNLFTKYRSGDLLARVVGDVESLQNFFLRVFYPPLVLGLVFLATIMFSMFYSFYIALLLLFGLLLTGIILPALFAVSLKKKKNAVRVERAKLSTDATEFMHGYRDLKIYQKLNEKQGLLEKSAASYVREQQIEGNVAMVNQTIHQAASLMISWGVLLLGAYLVSGGQLDGVFLAMLVMISLTAFENAAPMAVFPNHYEESRKASSRLNEVVKDEAQEKSIKPLSLSGPPSIEVKSLQFSFEGDFRPVLGNISAVFPRGSKTAIVGASGSGKSTLMQLLLKVQKADSGEVAFNETSINDVSDESIWTHANVVLQENHFFYGTIKDNLLIAKGDASDEELIEILHKVELSGFQLKDQVYEKGENLSGGEKQRLAIARAMLKGKSLWLLDEPTSSLDALTEKNIYRHLFQQAKDDTMIFITHRLTGLEHMDQIIVMDHGEIVESGSYEELMEKKGYFYEMKQVEREMVG